MMDLQEIIEIIMRKTTIPFDGETFDKISYAYDLAVEALEEIRQYRAIGTIEECREAIERRNPKSPDVWGDGYDNEGKMIYDMYDCPNCGESYEIDYCDYEFCPKCGQAIELRLDESED